MLFGRGPALLFVPGARPDRFDKAHAAADIVVLDLEDAVAAEAKDEARDQVIAAAVSFGEAAVVRINGTGTPWHAGDVAAAKRAGLRRLMLPKVESARDLTDLGDFEVIALCETAAGVTNAHQIAQADNCAALFCGTEDLIASLGGRSSRDAAGRFHPVAEQARSTVLLAAGAAGRPAIDTVHVAIDDLDGLARDATQAADSGFQAKACIHPKHVPPIRAAFAPTPEQIAWAHGVLEAAGSGGGAVFNYQGHMIDGPLLAHAKAITAQT